MARPNATKLNLTKVATAGNIFCVFSKSNRLTKRSDCVICEKTLRGVVSRDTRRDYEARTACALCKKGNSLSEQCIGVYITDPGQRVTASFRCINMREDARGLGSPTSGDELRI